VRLHKLSASLVVALLLASTAVAHAEDPILQEPDRRWQVELFHFRFSVFDQRGRGYQSKAIVGDPMSSPGSEKTEVVQPMAMLRIRHSETVTHDVTIPMDVISSASANALDAVSTASLLSEGGDIDVTTRVTRSEDDVLVARYGFHIEETLRSWYGGLGIERELAEDNATLSINATGIVDYFDELKINGFLVDRVFRYTGSLNASLSQLLSPTTIASLSYGVTYQSGVLERTWNSVPVTDSLARHSEKFPGTRLKHAASAWLSQHVPLTRTTVKTGYRYYRDDFGLSAHTAEARLYQYLGSRIIARGSYRFYRQTGADFYRESFPTDMASVIKTADSDLAPFDAHEVGAKLTFYFTPIGPTWRSRSALNVSYLRYSRDNDLTIDAVSFGYQHHY